jgi:hypothetical protein
MASLLREHGLQVDGVKLVTGTKEAVNIIVEVIQRILTEVQGVLETWRLLV